MKNRILLITSNFFPESTGIAVYSSDLAEFAKKENFDVTVATGLPHYPWWRVPKEFANLEEGFHVENGVRILRFKHYIPRKTSLIRRICFEMSFWLNGRKAIKRVLSEEFDLIISILPTISSGVIGRRVARKLSVPGLVIFQDLSTFAVKESGIPWAWCIWSIVRWLEAFAGSWAKKIITISPIMKSNLEKIILKSNKIDVIYNYNTTDFSSCYDAVSATLFREYEGSFLVLHTGNIGYKQDILNLVSAAKLLVHDLGIKFLIIGDGNMADQVKQEIQDARNISLIPLVSRDLFPNYLARADVLILNERPSVKNMSLPSKLTSYLYSGKPIIAATSEGGSTAQYLSSNAYVIPPGSPQLLADAIVKMKGNSKFRTEVGMRGKAFADAMLSKKVGRDKYIQVIRNCISIEETT